MLEPMSARADELMDEVLALPEDERRAFAEALVQKLAIDPAVLESWYDEAERRWSEIERSEVDPVQLAELDRRLDALEAEGPVGIPWDQVRDELADIDKLRDS